MPPQLLAHYLRRARRRAGLTQREVAWLLGSESGNRVARYERFIRRPTLDTAFAYEVIVGVSASELCAGIFREVQRRTAIRASALIAKIDCNPRTARIDTKIVLLRTIVEAGRDA